MEKCVSRAVNDCIVYRLLFYSRTTGQFKLCARRVLRTRMLSAEHRICRRTLMATSGRPPSPGMVESNHVSYHYLLQIYNATHQNLIDSIAWCAIIFFGVDPHITITEQKYRLQSSLQPWQVPVVVA